MPMFTKNVKPLPVPKRISEGVREEKNKIEGGKGRTGKALITRDKKKNNVLIMVTGEEKEEIKSKLLLALRKMRRKKELGFCITSEERVSFEVLQKFANFSLQISATDR